MSTSPGHTSAQSPASRNKRRLAVVLGLSASYMSLELAAGVMTGSLALIADAGHMLTDVGGLALALLGIWFAERPATPARTYGYYRAEILAAVANAVLLVGISAGILFEAWKRFSDPPEVASGPMLAVALGGLGVNLIGIFVLRSAATDSLNLRGAYFEVLSDLLASVGVVAGAAIMFATGWRLVDPVISAAIGLFILPRTWALLREALGVLLEGTPSGVNLTALRDALLAVRGVAGVHDLHVWSLTSGVNAMSVHVVLVDGADYDGVRSAVLSAVSGPFRIAHVTVQAERGHCGDAEAHA